MKSTDCQADHAANGGHTKELTGPFLSLPPSPDIQDKETLFAACTEEVYLGPPLCYSMVLTKKPRRLALKENVEYFSSLDPGCELNSLACLPGSKPIDGLQYLSQEGPSSKPGDSLSYLCPSKESVLDRNQDHVYFQGSSPTDETKRSFSPFPEPCYSSFFTSSSSNNVSVSKPEDDNPSPPPSPLVSSGTEAEKRGEDLYLLCDVAGGVVAASVSTPREERSRNEGPPYLNPRARVAPIDSSAAECSADTEMLESNMGAVMTKISVCSSATNPSKEPAAAATHINPKINCSAMRDADREERERRREVDSRRVKQEEMGRKERSGSQEAKTAAETQVSVPRISLSQDIIQGLDTAPHLSAPGISPSPSVGTNVMRPVCISLISISKAGQMRHLPYHPPLSFSSSSSSSSYFLILAVPFMSFSYSLHLSPSSTFFSSPHLLSYFLCLFC